jgi:Family of unknown function (DUF6069)
VTPDYSYRETSPGQAGPRQVNVSLLWTGGIATALVAALVALVGVVVARGIFSVPLLAPKTDGTWGNASTFVYLSAAAGAAVLATALMHGLLVATPQPFVFFGWIVGLLTLVAALAPLATDAETSSKVATGLINLAIGVAIWSLLAATGRRSLVRPEGLAPGPYQPGDYEPI